MEYHEFLEKCKEIYHDESLKFDGQLEETYRDKSVFRYWEKPEIEEARLYVEWETGGSRGGSCWGGVSEGYSSDDPPKELTLLDTILEKLCPNLSFLQFRRLCNNLMKYDSYSDNGDYYGNYTTYGYKFILLEELFRFLKENGFLNE